MNQNAFSFEISWPCTFLCHICTHSCPESGMLSKHVCFFSSHDEALMMIMIYRIIINIIFFNTLILILILLLLLLLLLLIIIIIINININININTFLNRKQNPKLCFELRTSWPWNCTRWHLAACRSVRHAADRPPNRQPWGMLEIQTSAGTYHVNIGPCIYLSLYLYLKSYIYICLNTHTQIYVYIYIYTRRH